MSKTERRKLFQPIPLSSILDPTYQSPFSKLEKFQVDMDISSKRPQQTVWQKLQSSLLTAMSNFVIMSSTSVAAMSHRSAHGMSLVPWKSFKHCELLMGDEVPDSIQSAPSSPQTTEKKSTTEKSASLYYSVRSGLQCLRYLATHPLQSDDDEVKQSAQTQTPTHYYDCRKQNNIDLPAVGYPIAGGGGALFFPLISTVSSTSRCSFSAPTSPSHHYHHQTLRPVVSNLFSWAMRGFPFSTPLHHRHLNVLYKNYCIFSPIHTQGAEINTTLLCPQKSSGKLESMSSSYNSKAESNIEIFFHSSSSTSQDSPSRKSMSIACPSTKTPTKVMSLPNSPAKTSSGNAGCIMIETNWRSLKDEGNSSSRTNIHTVSVCSSSAALNGGSYAFSCTSALNCPRTMMTSARTGARRFPTESESSVDSFVEFSASVESTDSFCIVFESAGGCIGDEDVTREEDDEEWEDEDDDDEEDSDDDDEDQILNYSNASDEIFIFQADGIDVGGLAPSCDQVDRCVDTTNPTRQRKRKTVSFDEEHLENILEFEDDVESKNSRETYWEMLARDHSRFQDRILRTGDILEPILQPAHRQKIFQQLHAENLK